MPSQEICIEKIESLQFKNCVCVCEGGGGIRTVLTHYIYIIIFMPDVYCIDNTCPDISQCSREDLTNSITCVDLAFASQIFTCLQLAYQAPTFSCVHGWNLGTSKL